MARVLDRLRALLLAGLPGCSRHFLSGATVAEMEELYFRARALVERVRQGVQTSLRDGRASPDGRGDAE